MTLSVSGSQPGWPTFEDFFRSTTPARDRFLARLFALFSEDVVRHWCRHPEAAYEDLGRPVLRVPGVRNGYTLDFTLRSRERGCIYIAELKCELEWEGYKYLRLTAPDQLEHHAGAAFRHFLEVARNPTAIPVTLAQKPIPVDGAVLVWGATTTSGCAATKQALGLADVLSVENMLVDLREWKAPEWAGRVDQVAGWCRELAAFLDPLGVGDDRQSRPRSTSSSVLDVARREQLP